MFLNSPKAFLALMGLSPSRGSLSPSSLMALTLKRYSWPSSRPSTSKKSGNLSPAHLPFRIHFLVRGHSISISYSWGWTSYRRKLEKSGLSSGSCGAWTNVNVLCLFISPRVDTILSLYYYYSFVPPPRIRNRCEMEDVSNTKSYILKQK